VVPHPQAEWTLAPALARENFDNFIAVRLQRLAAFQAWLKQHFGVVATLDEPGLRAVIAWVKRYGGGLVPDEDATNKAFHFYRPAWEDSFACCTVMVDLAIFIGEYLIAQRPHLRWICSLDMLKYHKRREISNLGRPAIGGFPHAPWSSDVSQMGSGNLLEAKSRSQDSHARLLLDPENTIKVCQQVLRMADWLDDGEPFIF
jgi:hypothetical protein